MIAVATAVVVVVAIVFDEGTLDVVTFLDRAEGGCGVELFSVDARLGRGCLSTSNRGMWPMHVFSVVSGTGGVVE